MRTPGDASSSFREQSVSCLGDGQGTPTVADATTRLAEPLGALSLATDLAVDLPSESALAATVLAVRIGEMCGMSAGVPRLHGDRRRGGIHGVG